MKMINCKLIVIGCNCLITCHLFLMIGDLVIFNNLIFAKCVPFFAPSWLEREEQLSRLRKNEHLVAKYLCSKMSILYFFV